MNFNEQQIEAIQRRKVEKETEKAEKERLYQEDAREDEVAEGIKAQIEAANFQDFEIQPIIEKIKKGNVKRAVAELNNLMGIDLSDREQEHFLVLPSEIVLSWFKKYIDKNEE